MHKVQQGREKAVKLPVRFYCSMCQKKGRKSSSTALQSKKPEYQCARVLFTLLSVFFGNRQNRIAGKQVIYGYEEILCDHFQRIDALRVRKEVEEALYGGFLERYYAENHVGRQRK